MQKPFLRVSAQTITITIVTIVTTVTIVTISVILQFGNQVLYVEVVIED